MTEERDLLPEERRVGSDDTDEQTTQILEESDERVEQALHRDEERPHLETRSSEETAGT